MACWGGHLLLLHSATRQGVHSCEWQTTRGKSKRLRCYFDAAIADFLSHILLTKCHESRPIILQSTLLTTGNAAGQCNTHTLPCCWLGGGGVSIVNAGQHLRVRRHGQFLHTYIMFKYTHLTFALPCACPDLRCALSAPANCLCLRLCLPKGTRWPQPLGRPAPLWHHCGARSGQHVVCVPMLY